MKLLEEEQVFDKQQEYIQRYFPPDVNYNQGWGVDDHGVSTKIYGYGVLTTDWYGNHTFEPFSEVEFE